MFSTKAGPPYSNLHSLATKRLREMADHLNLSAIATPTEAPPSSSHPTTGPLSASAPPSPPSSPHTIRAESANPASSAASPALVTSPPPLHHWRWNPPDGAFKHTCPFCDIDWTNNACNCAHWAAYLRNMPPNGADIFGVAVDAELAAALLLVVYWTECARLIDIANRYTPAPRPYAG